MSDASLAFAADRAVKRLTLARFARALASGSPWCAGAVVIGGVLAYTLAGGLAAIATGISACAMWLSIAGLYAWLGRPDARQALAAWDANTRRNELMLSAFCFEHETERNPVMDIHIRRAHAALDEELTHLPEHLPIGFRFGSLLLPALALLVAALLWHFQPGILIPLPVDQEERQRASDLADELNQDGLRDSIKGLEESEARELAELEERIRETSERMKKLNDETPREVLEELEQRAREAEKLAASLGSEELELSQSALAELERHADTVDLATALRAKDLKAAAEELEKLAERLADENLTLEEQRRLQNALQQTLSAGTDADRSSAMGQTLQQVAQQLAQRNQQAAGRQLQQLASRMNRAQQRQQSRRQLQQLANRMRNAGQQIFAPNQSNMQRLAGRQSPLQRMQPGRFPTGMNAPSGMMPGSSGMMPGGMMPGMMPGGMMPGMGMSPVPGSGMMPGQGQGAPIPGGGGNGSGQGGHQAGQGTSAPGGGTRPGHDAAGTSVVEAMPMTQGASQMSQVDPQGHREQAMRNSRELAIEFIQTEEEALAEEPLPLSRRQQVLRYFTMLREHYDE